MLTLLLPPPAAPPPLPSPLAPFALAAVLAQAGGALALLALFSWLGRRRGPVPPRHWARAWAGLLLAQAGLLLWDRRGFWVLYLAAGWYFLAALAAGCYELRHGGERERRRVNALLVPGIPAAAVLAGTLVPFFTDLGALRGFQAAVFAVGFAVVLALLRRPPAGSARGWRLLRAGLVWLLVQSGLEAALLLAQALGALPGGAAAAASGWLGWAPVADLCAQALAAAGMMQLAAVKPPPPLAPAPATPPAHGTIRAS